MFAEQAPSLSNSVWEKHEFPFHILAWCVVGRCWSIVTISLRWKSKVEAGLKERVGYLSSIYLSPFIKNTSVSKGLGSLQHPIKIIKNWDHSAMTNEDIGLRWLISMPCRWAR